MTAERAGRVEDCSPQQRVTKSLLGYGVLAGPLYLLASVVQGAITPGFSFLRDSWSLLSLGGAGWVHVLVFVLTGAMVVAAAAGLHRHLPGRHGRTAAAWLATYGVLLVVAGFALPDRPGGGATVHGLVHLAAGGIGFIAFAVAALVLARPLRRSGAPLLSAFGVLAGVALLAGFAAVATAAGAPAAVLGLTVAVVLAWAWLLLVSVRAYGEAAEIGRAEARDAASPRTAG